MVVFEFRGVGSVEESHRIMSSSGIAGSHRQDSLGVIEGIDRGTVTWLSEDFVGIFNKDTSTFELYGKKNTNSVKVYQKKYPTLKGFHKARIVKTKRW